MSENEKIIARVFADLLLINKGEEPIFETKEFYEKHSEFKQDYLEWLKVNGQSNNSNY